MKRHINKNSFEMLPKPARLEVRLAPGLLKSVKARAKKEGVNYQKIVRLALEWFLNEK